MNIRRRGVALVIILVFGAGGMSRAAEFNETTRLAALAKVWGFLKYYHPEVAKGEINWDKALIDVYERAQSADSREDFNQVLNDLFSAAGNVNFLNYPVPVPGNRMTIPFSPG